MSPSVIDMVQLLLRSLGGGEAVRLDVAPTSRLRDLQAVLCRLFRKNFPWHRASVVMGRTVHDHFESQPFLGCDGEIEVDVTVIFQRNVEDPFFFDVADRHGPRATVVEEGEWREAVLAGDAAAQADGCEAWAMSRRLKQRSA